MAALRTPSSTSKWTKTRIECPLFPPKLSEFDDAESTDTVTGSDVNTSVQALEGRVPNYLLFVSLLEHLCSLYEGDPERRRKIFNVLCYQLARMKVMPSFSFLEEFSVIREKYKSAFRDLMVAASQTIGTDGLKFPSTISRPSFPSLRGYRGNCHTSSSQFQELLQTGTSRYQEEFVEERQLGKGGFGSVFKVRNKLDGREYAVKKIPLKETHPDLCLKVLREVKVLARLSHANVVGYHAAWVEYATTDTVNTGLPRVSTHPTSLKEFSELSSLLGINRNIDETNHDSMEILFEHSNNHVTSSNGILFTMSGSSSESMNMGISLGNDDASTTDDSKVWPNDHCLKIPSSAGSHGGFSPCPPGKHGVPRSASSASLSSLVGREAYNNAERRQGKSCDSKRLGIILCIQMQLCTYTLSDWLLQRNYGSSCNANETTNVDIFRQIVKGVQYIHSEGLMHRDLKPRNIFLQRVSEEDHTSVQVKIGDFGLARKEVVISPGDDSPLASLIEPLTPLFHPNCSMSDAPTAGVGTCTYAAPEQLRNSNYDNKADMYSLGIILFELFCPFDTYMERVKKISDLRQDKLPQDFIQSCPEQAALVQQLTCEQPRHRPSAEALLDKPMLRDGREVKQATRQLSVKLELSEKEICELKRVNLEKDDELDTYAEEVARLRRELHERDELIRQLLATSKVCGACGEKFMREMQEMETR